MLETQVKNPKQNITMPIRYMKGVGPKKADLLNRLGIGKIEELLYYLPKRYEDRSNFTLIKDLKIGEYHSLKAKVLASGVHRTKRGMALFRLAVGDKTGILYCVWFNQPYLKKIFKPGQSIIVFGKVEKHDRVRIHHPEYEILKTEIDSIHMGRIVPIYSLTQDVGQRYIRFLAYEAVSNYASFLKETLPTHIRARKKMADISFTIRNIHFPHSFENLEKSYKRLVFEEFFLLQVALALKKNQIKQSPSGVRHKLDAALKSNFKKLFSFAC